MPLPYRYLTSLMVRYNGRSILIDCGEGTQMALRRKGWSPKPIDLILFTHYHADHISGLPGLLLTMGSAGSFHFFIGKDPEGDVSACLFQSFRGLAADGHRNGLVMLRLGDIQRDAGQSGTDRQISVSPD